MTRIHWRFGLLIVVAFYLASLTYQAFAAAGLTTYIPIVFGHPYAVTSVCDPSKPLLNTDVGSMDAALTADGDWIVAIQDRWNGSRIRVMRHEGDHLVDIPGMILASTVVLTQGLDPQLSPPGPKQGDMAIVTTPSGNRMYFTQREIDDTPNEGPYAVFCMPF